MIEEGIYRFLASDSGIAALAGTSIYEHSFPKDEVLPGIVFFSVTSTPVESLDGENALQIRRFQFDCYGKTARSARTLQAAVRAAFTAVAKGTTLPDNSELQSARVILDMDKPFELGPGGSIFCSLLDIELSFVPS